MPTGYAKVGAKYGHATVPRMKSYAMYYGLVSPCRRRDVDGQGAEGTAAPLGLAWHHIYRGGKRCF